MACSNSNPCQRKRVKGFSVNRQDLTGLYFEDLFVYKKLGVREDGHHTEYLCKCNCGGTVLRNSVDLTRKISTKCLHKEDLNNVNFIEYTNNTINYKGKIINSLEVKGAIGRDKGRKIIWLLECLFCNQKIKSNSANIKYNIKCPSCKSIDYNNVKYKESVPLDYIGLSKVYSSYISSANNRNLVFDLSLDLVKQTILSDCYYCGNKPSNSIKLSNDQFYLYNGIDRIDNTQGYTPENIRPCCVDCNYMKHINSEKDFLSRIIKIYNNLNL
jgi:phage FluMu protein Com